jgi:hypothetical protein
LRIEFGVSGLQHLGESISDVIRIHQAEIRGLQELITNEFGGVVEAHVARSVVDVG